MPFGTSVQGTFQNLHRTILYVMWVCIGRVRNLQSIELHEEHRTEKH